jgi:hypothetical protein
MKKFRLKAYTPFGVIRSKTMYSDSEIFDAIVELLKYTDISKVYKSDGKTSWLIQFTSSKQKKRTSYFTRKDGQKVYTLSIHESNYPMIAYYEDGSRAFIGLS